MGFSSTKFFFFFCDRFNYCSQREVGKIYYRTCAYVTTSSVYAEVFAEVEVQRAKLVAGLHVQNSSSFYWFFSSGSFFFFFLLTYAETRAFNWLKALFFCLNQKRTAISVHVNRL